MADYLLDTHIFLWSLIDPSALGKEVAETLEDPSNDLWLSPITIWETLVLWEKGRVKLDQPAAEWIREVLGTIPFKEAVLNHEVALQSRSIKLPHQDPADRFIAATAIVYGLTLVTADRCLIDNALVYKVLPNN